MEATISARLWPEKSHNVATALRSIAHKEETAVYKIAKGRQHSGWTQHQQVQYTFDVLDAETWVTWQYTCEMEGV